MTITLNDGVYFFDNGEKAETMFKATFLISSLIVVADTVVEQINYYSFFHCRIAAE